MKKTVIIILNWNGIEYLKMFLGTVVKYSAYPGTEVCVVDNGSSDGSAAWVENNFREVKVIRFEHNYGFAGGYNRAIDQLEAEYFVLINSDVEVTEEWLKPLTIFMDGNPDVAACQPKILAYHKKDHFEHAGAAGGFIDKYGYPFCRGRIFNRTEKDDGQYDDQINIFWSSGACMMVRSDAWKRCGGFDDDFFAHMEEIDLCWRFNRARYRMVFIPRSVVYHVGGGSLAYDSPFKIYLNFRNSLFMLYKNLPLNKISSIMFIRRLLDGLAAIRFLAEGRFGYFKSVWKAHMSFYKNLDQLKVKRETVRKLGEDTCGDLILNKSIVFEFFIRGKKTYRSLKTE